MFHSCPCLQTVRTSVSSALKERFLNKSKSSFTVWTRYSNFIHSNSCQIVICVGMDTPAAADSQAKLSDDSLAHQSKSLAQIRYLVYEGCFSCDSF